MNAIEKKTREFIHKYLQVSEKDEATIVEYALKTWQPLEDRLKYLHFIGGVASGKTRSGHVMEAICKNAFRISGVATKMALLVKMDMDHPVLIIDEANLLFSDDNEEMMNIFSKILKYGASKSQQIIKIMEAPDEKLYSIPFNVFGHKVLISRERFHDNAIESRCILIKLKPNTRTDIPLNLGRDFLKEKNEIQSLLENYFGETK